MVSLSGIGGKMVSLVEGGGIRSDVGFLESGEDMEEKVGMDGIRVKRLGGGSEGIFIGGTERKSMKVVDCRGWGGEGMFGEGWGGGGRKKDVWRLGIRGGCSGGGGRGAARRDGGGGEGNSFRERKMGEGRKCAYDGDGRGRVTDRSSRGIGTIKGRTELIVSRCGRACDGEGGGVGNKMDSAVVI